MKFWYNLIAASLILVSFPLSAQVEVEIDKNRIYAGKDGFREAWRNVKKGDDFYEMGSQTGYQAAINFYLKVLEYNSNVPEINYKLGACYLYSQEKSKALDYLQKAYEKNQKIAGDILLLLGEAHQIHYNFDEAIDHLKRYQATLSPSALKQKADFIEKHIQECERGKKMVNDPVRVVIENMGKPINTKYPEYSPLISADGSKMIFTSRRPNTTGEEIDPYDLKYYEDVYITHKKEGEWTAPKNLGEPINTDKHDATVGISYNGQHLFVFKDKRNGDIYESVLQGENWSKPRRLPRKINSRYHESSGCYSFDGKSFFFISDNPETSYGGKDIYVSHKDNDGSWTDPKNVGAAVNTPYNEEGVFLVPDGRTMYFSSEGHTTMGGYDVFRTIKNEKGEWSTPENLGYPVNTPDDDVFFVITASGKKGYISSVREEGLGNSDIYKITFLGEEKPQFQSTETHLLASIAQPTGEVSIESSVEVKTIRLTLVKGKITDAKTEEPLRAQVIITDNEKNETVFESFSNKSTGEYMVSLPSGHNYGITVKAEGYLFHSENFDIAGDATYNEVNKNIELMDIAVGSKIVLNNIFFDSGESSLRDESIPELERAIDFMQTYPDVRIEISGHTDNVGSYQLNERLSKARAKAVTQYLTDNGIDPGRLEAKGYSSSEPIASNKTSEGRQKNRRVEFKVIGN